MNNPQPRPCQPPLQVPRGFFHFFGFASGLVFLAAAILILLHAEAWVMVWLRVLGPVAAVSGRSSPLVCIRRLHMTCCSFPSLQSNSQKGEASRHLRGSAPHPPQSLPRLLPRPALRPPPACTHSAPAGSAELVLMAPPCAVGAHHGRIAIDSLVFMHFSEPRRTPAARQSAQASSGG